MKVKLFLGYIFIVCYIALLGFLLALQMTPKQKWTACKRGYTSFCEQKQEVDYPVYKIGFVLEVK